MSPLFLVTVRLKEVNGKVMSPGSFVSSEVFLRADKRGPFGRPRLLG